MTLLRGSSPKVIVAATILMMASSFAFTPSSAQQLAQKLSNLVNCASSAPCDGGRNSSTGPGVSGFSAKGSGVVGQTAFNGTYLPLATAGVLGEDQSTSSTLTAGVRGTSIRGYGVLGISKSGAAVFGDALGTGDGVAGLSFGGSGVTGASSGGPGVLAIGGASNSPSLLIEATTGGINLIRAINDSGASVMRLDDRGNLYLSGKVHPGVPLEQLQTQRPPAVTGAQTAPTTEGYGQGSIQNGSGYVLLGAAVARSARSGSRYFVFLTPKGDNRGLYVTAESPAGFWVRESQAGRSNLQFDYRIVVK